MSSTAVGVEPAFATDPATWAYYDRRAAEYDDWYLGTGLFASRARPGWHEELEVLLALVGALPAARTLDVACGTGFLSRHLSGFTVGLDQSPAMITIAQSRLPEGLAVRGDALSLPFASRAFERVLAAHFYGHLPPSERERFLGEARRVAPELVVIDTAFRPGAEPERCDERVLNDGSRHRVFKRFLTGAQLAREIDGRVLMDGHWFVAAQARTT
jgi:demethylmenaquinone methyltransferase/2-methoxy-6-polyprenyl-1,4-benzoquinol methylase